MIVSNFSSTCRFSGRRCELGGKCELGRKRARRLLGVGEIGETRRRRFSDLGGQVVTLDCELIGGEKIGHSVRRKRRMSGTRRG